MHHAESSKIATTHLRSELARRTLEAAVWSEAALSGARITFCLLVMAVFLLERRPWADPPGVWAGTIEGALCLVSILFSAMVLWRRSRNIPVGWDILTCSVVLDVVIASGLLALNVFSPGDQWRGVLRSHDLAVMLAIVAASSLRQAPKLVLVSAASCVACVAGVVWLDETYCPVWTENAVNLGAYWTVLLFGVSAAAFLTAWQSERLAAQSAATGLSAKVSRE